jgi:hypothetical protein
MEELVCDIRFVVDWDQIVLVGILLFTINHLTSMTAFINDCTGTCLVHNHSLHSSFLSFISRDTV